MFWALIAAAVASALTAAARTAHHAVKTRKFPHDDLEGYGGIALSGIPIVGNLLEQGLYDLVPGGKEGDWERSGIQSGISLATLGIGAGLDTAANAAVTAASTAADVAAPVVEAAGEAASAGTNVVGELATAAGERAADVGAGVVEVAKTQPAILTAQTVPGKATQVAAQFPETGGALAGEALAEGGVRSLGESLANIGQKAGTVYDDILEGATRFGQFVNTNIRQPISTVTQTPDRLVSGVVGGGKIADKIGGVAGDTLRGAAMGAAQDPKRPGRGALMGAAGGAVNSTFAAALGGVVPREVDITYETAVANRERIPLGIGETLDSTGATGLGRDPYLSPADVGFKDEIPFRQRIPLDEGYTLETTGASGVGPAGDPTWAASSGFSYPLMPKQRFNPTFGQQVAASALDKTGSTLGNIASTKVGQALTPEEEERDPLSPSSLGQIGPMQRARLYGRSYSRPNVRRYYL